MQNLISLSLTAQQLEQVDGALATLRQVLGPMIALTPQQRRELAKMGAPHGATGTTGTTRASCFTMLAIATHAALAYR